jgi:hypothetical protein
MPKLVALLESARANQQGGLLHNALLAIKHATTMHDNNLRSLLAHPNIVETLVGIVQNPPAAVSGAIGFHAEDTAREAVFCLRNVTASASGSEAIRRANGPAVLTKVNETARSEALRIAATVVLQQLSKHR